MTGGFFGANVIVNSQRIIGNALAKSGFNGAVPAPSAALPLMITGFSLHLGTFTLTVSPAGYTYLGQLFTSFSGNGTNFRVAFNSAGLAVNFFNRVTFTNNIFGSLVYTTATVTTFDPTGPTVWEWDMQTFNAGSVGGSAGFS